ncbi:MAG: hypothetical protein ACJAXJ_003764 [Colwellia sp.]|jgi:hypothetical protein
MSAATLSNLLAQMHQNQEVLNGWDAVMSLLESSVNAFFEQQWQAQTSGAGVMTISGMWCDGVSPISGTFITNVVEFTVTLGTPLFQFAENESSVKVTQKITGGTLKQGSKEVSSSFSPPACGCTAADPTIEWGTPVQIDLSKNPNVSGAVPLSQVQGSVAADHSLVLDFAQGSFTLNNLDVTGVNNTDFVAQIKNWYVSHDIKYTLATINTQNISGLASLTPSSFQFNVVTTNAGNTLIQLLMTTDGNQPSIKTINVSEPVPTADNLTCSLIVSSRILYQNILVAGFNKTNQNINLYPRQPSTSAGSWTAFMSPELVFKGSFSFGSCCDRTTVTYSIPLGGTYSGTATQGFHLYQTESSQGNVHVDITVNAYYPASLSGSGATQSIKITAGTPSVTVTGSAEAEIKSTLESILNNNFKNGMQGISFAPISCLALENLVFPENLISMAQVQVPADLLIVGTFTPTR